MYLFHYREAREQCLPGVAIKHQDNLIVYGKEANNF
jgi:hypothetical protein